MQFAPVDQAPGVSSSVAGLNNSGAVLGALSENAGYDTPYADSLDRLYRPQALEIPVLVARDGPIATLDPSKVGTLVAAMPTPSAVRHEPPAPEPVAERAGVPLDVAPVIREIFDDGQDRYGPRAWSSGIVRRLEEACGSDLRAPGFPEEIVDTEPEAPGAEVVVAQESAAITAAMKSLAWSVSSQRVTTVRSRVASTQMLLPPAPMA